MKLAGLVVLVATSGCIRSGLVDCGDGRACPAATRCATAADQLLCVAADEVVECAGKSEFETCASGACYTTSIGLVCLPGGCGNRRVDPGETCDDGNAVTGDGCSVSCMSDETCGNGIVDPVAGEQCDDGNLAGHDGCTSDCRSETPRWEKIIPGLPDARFSASLAYDSARDRVVLFGGIAQSGIIPAPLSDTWEWDGVGWVHVPTAIGPSPRMNPTMVYDAARRRVVLFGGTFGGSYLGDTWEWDGTQWLPRTPATSPPVRSNAAGFYDPPSKHVVIFGGQAPNNSVLGDTWEWNGSTWTERVVASPPARFAAAVGFDPRRGVTVLAGGQAPSLLTDTWEWDGAAWTPVDAPTPTGFSYISLAYDGIGLVGFGGIDAGDTTATTYRYDGQTWDVLPPSGTQPLHRDKASVVADPVRGSVLLVGGFYQTTACGSCYGTRSDLWRWNGANTTWTQQTSPMPSARGEHAIVYDPVRRKHLMVGGVTQYMGTTALDETWELVEGGSWRQATSSPAPARSYTAMAYDAARGNIVLFGGRGGSTALSDTWIWNNVSWSKRLVTTIPPGRYGHALSYDEVRQRVVMVGGFSGSTTIADAWEWDGTDWSPIAAPPARAFHQQVYDPVARRTLVFGGDGSDNLPRSDAWAWDGTAWTSVASQQMPPARDEAGAAWNPARRRTSIYGGRAGVTSFFEDLWELGAQWEQTFVPGAPSRRAGATLTPLRDGTGVLLFGGFEPVSGTPPNNELWRLRWYGDTTYEACTVDVDDDGDGLAGCADPDCAVSCATCGNGTCEANESCRLCPQDCTCAPVCGDNFCDPGETAATCHGDC